MPSWFSTSVACRLTLASKFILLGDWLRLPLPALFSQFSSQAGGRSQRWAIYKERKKINKIKTLERWRKCTVDPAINHQDLASQWTRSSSGAALSCLADNEIFTRISKSYAIHHRLLCCCFWDFWGCFSLLKSMHDFFLQEDECLSNRIWSDEIALR